MLGRRVEVLGDLQAQECCRASPRLPGPVDFGESLWPLCQGPKFRVGELAGEPVPLVDGEIVEFGICKDRADRSCGRPVNRSKVTHRARRTTPTSSSLDASR